MAKKKVRVSNEINASSMADIAFLLLIFFLVTTTIESDKGIYTVLPQWDEEWEDVDVNRRNVLNVLVNSRDQLLVNDEVFQANDLREKAKQHILYDADSPRDAVVSLLSHKGTTYGMYITVQNELKAAYTEIWNEQSMQRYGKKYAEIEKSERKAIRKDYPRKFSEAEPESQEI